MRAEKQFLLDEIQEHLEHFPSFVVTDYAGLKANESAAIRSQLKRLGSRLAVVRKRVLSKALALRQIDLPSKNLQGHVGVVFAEAEALETFKFLCQCSKETNRPLILMAQFEEKLIDAQTVKLLASLPNLDEMRSQFLGTLEAPMAQTLAVFEAFLVREAQASQQEVTTVAALEESQIL